MSRYVQLNGVSTDENDPERVIWYAARMSCGYWTDDWSKLDSIQGIPACPHCGCVGMQGTAKEWFDISDEFLSKHPRYDKWLPLSKEHCGVASTFSFLKRYALWLSTQ